MKSIFPHFSRIKRTVLIVFWILLIMFVAKTFVWMSAKIQENSVLKKVIARLSADSRIAEVLVTRSIFDETTQKIETTIKFLEYDSAGKPLEPQYFTFKGNLIQFQALVIRFQDDLVRSGDRLRGKSAYLFLKAFMLDGQDTEVFEITPVKGIPKGYKVPGLKNSFEEKLWAEFWDYALNPEAREHAKIKNAQIEAPGSVFLPGTIYTLKIEHDGGIRIDTKPVPEILKGETIDSATRVPVAEMAH